MNANPFTKNPLIEKILAALVFTAIGSFIIVVFSPYRPMLAKTSDYLGRILLIFALAALVWAAGKYTPKYRQILLGLFILAVTVSMDRIFGIYVLTYLNVTDLRPSGWAIQKFNEFCVVVCTILVMVRGSGDQFSILYLQKGNLKWGLIVGLSTFFLAALGSFPMAALFKAQNLTLAKVLPWTPWLLIYVLSNGAMEELMFRGLFLKRLDPIFGKFLSNFLIALVFTGIHLGATYTADQRIFLTVTFPLALLWGYIAQKTDSLWGSILFHAGMDIPIMLGIFANL